MKKTVQILNFICSIVNIFLLPYVIYKVYGYYSPEVGFNLPELSYLNVFALRFILGYMWFKPMNDIRINEIHDYIKEETSLEETTYRINGIKLIIISFVSWFFAWLFHIIIY